MDGTQLPPQEQPPVTPIFEMYSAPVVVEQIVDAQRFEPYSIGATIHAMFEEAERYGDDEAQYWESVENEQSYPNDTEAFRMYMKEVYRELKGSDAVNDLRMEMKKEKPEVTADMVNAVFASFERIVDAAAKRLRDKLSPEQLQALRQSGRQNLDWSYRGLLAERLTQADDAPVRYALEDFFLILNPKAKKVQYMERQEILKSLRYSMALGSKERLQSDVRLARQFVHEDTIGEKISDDDLNQFETPTN